MIQNVKQAWAGRLNRLEGKAMDAVRTHFIFLEPGKADSKTQQRDMIARGEARDRSVHRFLLAAPRLRCLSHDAGRPGRAPAATDLDSRRAVLATAMRMREGDATLPITAVLCIRPVFSGNPGWKAVDGARVDATCRAR